MQSQSTGYKWATWILVVIVIILGIMLWKKDDQTVTGTFDDINQTISECRTDLAAWREEYPETATRTPEAEGELQDIIDNCMSAVEEAQGTIGGQEETRGY
jgi:hypothetical protein